MIREEDRKPQNGLTDIHNHILWGFDDGPRSPEEMYRMLDEAYRQGIRLIFATSHAYPRHRVFHMDKYLSRLEEANKYCENMGYDLSIMKGSEINYSDSTPNGIAKGKFPCLADTRWVLLEFYPDSSMDSIEQAVDEVYRYGYKPILAHVERYKCFSHSPKKALQFKQKYGAGFQVNCETILSPRGLYEKRFVRKMLEEYAIDLIASDAHDTKYRPFMLKDAYERLLEITDKDYADKLVRFGWRILNR